MGGLFETLTAAVGGAPLIALFAGLVWGVLSVVLSPCHLASIPLIVGYIGKRGLQTTREALWLSVLFALGILATILLVGLVTAMLGRVMGQVGSWADYVVAAVLFLVGLHLVGVIPLPGIGGRGVTPRQTGPLGALLLGLIFGLALGPCTFAYMAPMLAVVFQVASASLVYALIPLVAFGVGHCAVLVVAGVSTEAVQRYLNWSSETRGTALLAQVCGVLVILGGLYVLYQA